MKIAVKDIRDEVANRLANDVIEIAKKKAEQGITSFMYPFNRDCGTYSHWVISRVRDISEGTVDCAYRGNYGHEIKFCISY